MRRTLSTANIKEIGKTVTLGQALLSLLRYTFFDYNQATGDAKRAILDWDTAYTNWVTPHQILNLHKEYGSDFRSRNGNGPACQQHNKKLLPPAKTAAIHQTIAHYGSLEDIGPFPQIKSHGLLQLHILWSHEHRPTKIAICSQCRFRLITNIKKFDRITPVLRDQLPWLPIRQRSLTFGDLERSDQGHLLKNRVSVLDGSIVTIKH